MGSHAARQRFRHWVFRCMVAVFWFAVVITTVCNLGQPSVNATEPLTEQRQVAPSVGVETSRDDTESLRFDRVDRRYDIGKIACGDRRELSLTISNVGPDAVMIHTIETSCGCIAPTFDESLPFKLEPSGSLSLQLTIDAGDQPGTYKRWIRLTTDEQRDNPVIALIDLSVGDGDGCSRTSARTIDAGRLPVDYEPVVFRLPMSAEERDIAGIEAVPDSPFLSIAAELFPDDTASQWMIRLEQGMPKGAFNGSITFLHEGQRVSEPILVRALVIEQYYADPPTLLFPLQSGKVSGIARTIRVKKRFELGKVTIFNAYLRDGGEEAEEQTSMPNGGQLLVPLELGGGDLVLTGIEELSTETRLNVTWNGQLLPGERKRGILVLVAGDDRQRYDLTVPFCAFFDQTIREEHHPAME